MLTEALAPEDTGGVGSAIDNSCAHCGLPVPAALVRDDAPSFCCTGCGTAYALLLSNGLSGYYDFAERREAPAQGSGRSYEAFDHPAFAELYVRETTGGRARTELYLEGVHCASCVWLVERLPLLQSGVARAELDVRRALAVIEWDPRAVSLSTIAGALDALGYAPHPYRGVTRASMRKKEDRAMLVRIGVAGAIAINVMLAALALYAGEVNTMDARFTTFFRWVSLALVVPSFVWPGRVFFQGAWSAVRTRSLHMDLPIAIALAAGFVQGAVNTVRGSGPVYFDGLAILIFALLVGRFLQQRGQRLAADAAELLHALAPRTARIVEGTGDAMRTREVPAEALLPGMVLDVRAGDTFAADGIIVDGRSTVNAALLTGESVPTRVTEGTAVYAGTQNVEAPLRVRVEQAGESSRIATLMRQVEAGAQRRAPIVMLANRLAGGFTAIVLIVAALTFVIKAQMAPSVSARALDDAIALLIVTCPCALALATPLAITVAIGRAASRGILVRGGDAIETLATPGLLVLDKTGTLTEGRTALVEWAGPTWVQPLVFALEAGSSHPLADGFRRAWPELADEAASIPIRDAHHTAGGGLEGVVDGHHVRIGSPRFVAQGIDRVALHAEAAVELADPRYTPVHIAVDGELIAVAALGDRIRDDAAVALATLRARGWRTVMLSGDAPSVARAVGEALDFAFCEVVGGATPEAKLDYITRAAANGTVVMVGDGVNDAAAMAAASVGIGVHGGAEACLASADVYLTRPGLTPLVELVDGAQRTMRVIRRNIAFSVGYNIIGAGLAIAGLLSPLIAAILMPTSSVTVVLGSWYGRTFTRDERTRGASQ